MSELYRITKPVRLIEFFSGLGSQAMALRDLGVDFESWRTSEWETDAIAAYKAIHCESDNADYSLELMNGYAFDDLNATEKAGLMNESLGVILYSLGVSGDGKGKMPYETIMRKNLGWKRMVYNNIRATRNMVDITKITWADLGIEDTDKYEYIVTYSFPCQDLSVAGKQAGMKKGSGTRSGLLWEVERILTELAVMSGQLPQVLLMENVPQVHGKNNLEDFQNWLSFLEGLGYRNYWQDLNAKDYGVAQSRNRCFCVSLLGDYTYTFPSPIELTKTMEDYLEDEVDEKFYIKSDKAYELINKLVVEDKIPVEGIAPDIDPELAAILGMSP